MQWLQLLLLLNKYNISNDRNYWLSAFTTVTAERPRGGKLTELMANHVLRNVDGDVGFAIVNGDGEAYHVGDDHGGAGPGLDHAFTATAFLGLHDLVVQTVEYVRAFF